MPAEPTRQDDGLSGGHATRTLVTLLLLVHLFFVAVATWSRFAPSPVQARLLDRFAFYTRSLQLDPDFTAESLRPEPYRFAAEPLFLTHATEDDVDYRIELLPAGQDLADDAAWVVLGADSWRGGESWRRHQRLGKFMAAVSPDDASVARIAQSVAGHAQQQRELAASQIRCRRHMLQGMTEVTQGTLEEQDPNSAVYFRTPYAANVLLLESGVQVVKIDEASQVAQPGRAEDAQPGR